MSATALLLLLVAAAVHAGWNLLVKQAGEKHVFSWWALVTGGLLFLPLVFWGAPWPARVWPYALASGLAEAGYFALLAWAYRLTDFSLAYPLARGAAPALLALWAVLWLRETPRPGGVLGLGTLVLGLLIVGATGAKGPGGRARRPWAGIAAALAVGVLISLYSVIDGAAVRFVPPVPYTALVLALGALLVTPAVLLLYDRRALLAEWRRSWRRILLVGPLMLLSYGLVLIAYTLAPVSYAGAVREVSILFAALAGWRWLREPLGRWRLAGAGLICAGILLIAFAG
ncbi:MAG: EamA family transporter [Thermoanaerobaculia bacterium]